MQGRTLGHYEILEPLGAGGMGEVYRARDTKLERDVAIKVLPEDFATDQERLARFEREAKVLASLNHANIAAIYGLEEAEVEGRAGDVGSFRFIAMECVEGETLAELLAAGRMEVDEALEIARQIAEALEAAHESGVIHRDLKPANVKVTPEGKVKVLDFGLAKAYEADGSPSEISPDLSQSPTVAAATHTGVILGTAAYMSPEQARGKLVDKRTDIWAFGCVLYELLCGRRAFVGETVSDTMAAILKEEPSWEALPDSTPGFARALLERCLRKDPHVRLRDIGEARVLLDEGDPTRELAAGPASRLSATSHGASSLGRRRETLAIGGAIVVAALAFWAGSAFRLGVTDTPSPPQHLSLATPEGVRFKHLFHPLLAISPDGRRIAYVGSTGSRRELYVQDLSLSGPARALPGTVSASVPFFSPDGEQIAFERGGMLWATSVAGGQQPVEITPAEGILGGFWAPDGSIFFVPTFGAPLRRVSLQQAIEDALEPGPTGEFTYPQLLPDGEHVLLTTWDGRSHSIVVASLTSGALTKVAEGAMYGRYVPTGHLLYMRGTEMVAARFDLGSERAGDPVVVAENVVTDVGENFADFSVADDGTLVYLEAEPGGRWLHRLRPGEEPESLNTEPLTPAIDYLSLRVSPRGDLVVLSRDDMELWVYDLNRNQVDARLTTAAGYDWQPVWSLDGQRVVFSSSRSGHVEFWEVEADGREPPRLLLSGDQNKWPGSWSPDGTLAYHRLNPDGGSDVYLFSPGEGGEPRPLLDTTYSEQHPSFSPDGRLVAYTSDNTGHSEVYVARYPALDSMRRISTGEAVFPRFARDGSAIFYSRDDVVMKVEIIDAETMEFSEPEEFVRGVDANAWDILPDGSAVIAVEKRAQSQLRLILDAATLFERR